MDMKKKKKNQKLTPPFPSNTLFLVVPWKLRPDDEEANAQPRISALFNQSGGSSSAASLAQQRQQYSTFASKKDPRPQPLLMQEMALRSAVDF